MPSTHTNRLIDTSSPYLLQHAHNPVDWYPWGEAAFEAAKAHNKPLFLSVGYSTCHWCHVMAHESFEHPEVARLLNEHFVPVKVDREQHPDVDAQYMVATQLMTQRGGWPNSVWLTPDGRPWFAGTYFPREDTMGRPGFKTVLSRLAAAWKNQRDDVDKQADQLAGAIRRIEAIEPNERAALSRLDIRRAVDRLGSNHDDQYGGFGAAPKFPPHDALDLLIRYHRQTGETAAMTMVTRTLDAMARGGVHDQIGGGFHRYATDHRWLVPHFEKMLYDNAQLLRAYAAAFERTGHEGYRRIADRLVGWLKREMLDARGGFHSAIDADSEGEEGRFYVWTADEIRRLLRDGAGLFLEAYAVRDKGNWSEQATGRPTGTNILHLPKPIGELAEAKSMDGAELRRRLDDLGQMLREARDQRQRPHTDDKVLACWNGLVIGALAEAGRLLHRPEYVERATAAARFILEHMQSDGQLLRAWRTGQAEIPGYLDDYAFLVDALIDLHETTGDQNRLDEAKRLADAMIERFADADTGAFYFTAETHGAVLGRSTHPLGAGNTPNPNAVAAKALVRLATATGESTYRVTAARCLLAFAGAVQSGGPGPEAMLWALDAYLGAAAVDALAGRPPVLVEAITSHRRLAPGQSLRLSVRLTIDSPFHLYAPDEKHEHLAPVELSIEGGEHVTAGEVEAPPGESINDPVLDKAVKVYTGEVTLSAPLTVSSDASGELAVRLAVRTQACDPQRCLAPQAWELTVPVAVDQEAG